MQHFFVPAEIDVWHRQSSAGRLGPQVTGAELCASPEPHETHLQVVGQFASFKTGSSLDNYKVTQ